MYVAGQIVGIFVTIFAVLSLQCKEMKNILLMQIVANLLLMLNYWLLDAFSGATIAIIATVQTVIMFGLRMLDDKISKKSNLILTIFITVVFAGIFIYSSITTYRSHIDILSALASLAFCVCIVQKNATICRILAMANALLWIGYDIGTYAYTTILTHSFSFISTLVGMIRLDIPKLSKKS